jgi:hypothetical protein
MDNKDKKQLDIFALSIEITEAVNEVFKKHVGIGLLSGGGISVRYVSEVGCTPYYSFQVDGFEYTVYRNDFHKKESEQ